MINVNDALVLMIDVQERLVLATKGEIEALNALKIIKAANILNIKTIVTEQYPKGLGLTLEDIRACYNDQTKVFEKCSFSALLENEILNEIEKTSKKQVILFGIELHICVLQTALDLISKGYEVFVVKNASKSRCDEDFKVGLELLKSKGANILTLEILLFDLLKTSKHPNFKEIQALIK